MAAKRTAPEEQLEALRRQLTEAGVKILSGTWGGKSGLARYKGQWLLVVDRHLPIALKVRLFQSVAQHLNGGQQEENERPPEPPVAD